MQQKFFKIVLLLVCCTAQVFPAASSNPVTNELRRIGREIRISDMEISDRQGVRDFAQGFREIRGDLANNVWLSVYFVPVADYEADQGPAPQPLGGRRASPPVPPRDQPSPSPRPLPMPAPKPAPAPYVPSPMPAPMPRPGSSTDVRPPAAPYLEIPATLRDVQRIWDSEFAKNDWSELSARALGHYVEDKFAELENLQSAYQLLYCRLCDICGSSDDDASKRAKTYVEMLQENMDAAMAYEIATEGVRFPSPKPRIPSPVGPRTPSPVSPVPKPRTPSPEPFPLVEEKADVIRYRQDPQTQLSDICNAFGAIGAVAQALQQAVSEVRGMQNLTEIVVAETAYRWCGTLGTITYMSFDELRDRCIDPLKNVLGFMNEGADCATACEMQFQNPLGDIRLSEAFGATTTRTRLPALRAVLKRISDQLTPAQRALMPRRSI